MSLRGCWGGEFGGSFFMELDGERTGSSPLMAVEAGSARSGGFGYRFTTDGDVFHTPSLRVGGNTFPSGEPIALRFYMMVESLPGQRLGICNFTSFFQLVCINPDGRLDLGTETEPRFPVTDATIIPGVWHRVEVAISYSSSFTGRDLVSLRLDGDLKERRCVDRVDTGGDAHDRAFIGWADIHGSVAEAGLVMHVDDVAITSGSWPGDGQVERLEVASMEFGEAWVPGSWRNVADLADPDEVPGNPFDCYCGPQLLGTEWDPVVGVTLVDGFNASPPEGFAAFHSLDVGSVDEAYGRDYGEDKMVSSPGRDKFLEFLSWLVGGCLFCGDDGHEGLGGVDQYQWSYPAHPMEGNSSFVCNLFGASGSVRGAYWVLAAARGSNFPSSSTGLSGSFATVFIPGMESSTPRNLSFDTDLTDGSDWPSGWSTFAGPVHDRPGSIAAVEMERDPGLSPVQVCVMTVVADVGAGDDDILECKRLPMMWL